MTQTPTEYAALNFDGTERRANYRTVAYRIDILHLCDGKDAAAILFEVIYRWQTEYRKSEIEKEIERRKKNNAPPLTEEEVDNMMWVWMSYNDFVRETGGAVAYNTVIRMLDYLVETAQLMECRENHDPRYPDYEYRIRMSIVKEKLKALPPAPVFLPKVPKKKEKKSEESTQVGTAEKRSTQKGRRALKSTQVGTVSTQTGTATTQVGTEVYPNRGTSHNYSHTSHIQHTEESVPATISPSDDSATSPDDRDAHTLFAFQVQGHERFYYHDYCIHAQDRGINDGLTLIVKNLGDVPQDAECSICYKPVHGPHGYDELLSQDEYAHSPLQIENESAEQAMCAAPAPTSVKVAPSENDNHSHLSTLTGTYPQASAKVDPASTRRRQPKAPKVDPAELQKYLDVFDRLFQEVTGNPDEGYICSGEDRKELTTLLEANLKKPRYVTPEKLRVVYLRLWNKPKDERTGFYWQEHMKIKNVCKQYPQEAMTLSAQASQKAAKNATDQTVSGLKRWTPPSGTRAQV